MVGVSGGARTGGAGERFHGVILQTPETLLGTPHTPSICLVNTNILQSQIQPLGLVLGAVERTLGSE